MKLLKLTSLLIGTLLVSSCAIFTDEPVKKTYTGTVLYSDGTPAVGASVVISSAREYIPVFLALAPHQPIRNFGRAVTDEKGDYVIAVEVSQNPTVSVTVYREEDPQIQTPFPYPELIVTDTAEDGQTLRLITWDEHLDQIKQ